MLRREIGRSFDWAARSAITRMCRHDSAGWKGYALDVLDAGAFRRYWDAVVEPLIIDAGPMAGTIAALSAIPTVGKSKSINWTPTLREEFRQRRGYDLLRGCRSWPEKSSTVAIKANRFLYDFRRTMGDLAIDHHYKLFRDGRATSSVWKFIRRAAGRMPSPIDAQQCLGWTTCR